jgi:DnaK suppressor protein
MSNRPNRPLIISPRDRLLALREELELIVASGDESAAVVELDQSKVGRLSRMDAMQAQAMAQASGHRREAMLRNIDAALKRVEDGSYGLCRDCEEPINPKRLEFDPTALRCIDCASNLEQ